MGSIRNMILAIPLIAGFVLAQGGPPPEMGGPGPHPGFGHGMGFGGPPVTGAPFSATRTITHQQTLADGNAIQKTDTEKIYRDTDGRTRTEATITTPSGTKTMITITDPVAGFIAHLNPADSTAVKMTLPTPPAGSTPPPHRADSNRPQPVKTDLGTQTIAGLNATGTSYTLTIPANAMGNAQPITETRTVWISTDLKIAVQATSSDPLHGNSSMTLSNVAAGTQDPTLFQIPASYTVKTAPAHRGPGGPGGPPPADGAL